jgi:DNA-binding response OmpR family regulator
VTAVQDGKAGIEAIMANRPDLVILDVMMPELDGWDVCRRIKSDPHLRSIPVIILTARPSPGAVPLSVESGADVYMEKPWDRGKLIDHVNTLLQRNS